MATYQSLYSLRNDPAIEPLRQKIAMALIIKANAVSKAAPNAAQRAWALSVLSNAWPDVERVLNYILGEYNATTTAIITGATDVQVQAAVDAAVNTLLGA